MNRTPGLPSGCQPAWLKRYCRVLTGLAYGGHDVKGVENVPLSGPLIVAAIHRSYLDPILISAFLPRTLYFMGKRELFRVPLLGAAIRRFGALPIDRQGARGSTFHAALGILKRGGALVIFPEGGIVDSFSENRFKAGVGSLASMSGAPILPVVIAGSKVVPQRRSTASKGSRLVIRVGPTIQSSRRRGWEARQDIVRLTLNSIKAMMQEVEVSQSVSRGLRAQRRPRQAFGGRTMANARGRVRQHNTPA